MTPDRRQRRIADYRQRLRSHPDARVFAPLADLLRQEGELDEALAILDRGLARHPTYLTARVVQGRTLLDAGRPDQAREVLHAVLARDGENIVVLRLLAEEALGRGDAAQARPLLEELVVLDPEPDLWRAALAELGSRAGTVRSEGEEPPVGGSRDLDPSFATMTLVDIYLAQGYRDKARTVLARILAGDPERTDAAERLAALADHRPPGAEMSPLDGNRDGPVDPTERSRWRSERRRKDKKSFEEWIDRLRDEGSRAP